MLALNVQEIKINWNQCVFLFSSIKCTAIITFEILNVYLIDLLTFETFIDEYQDTFAM